MLVITLKYQKRGKYCPEAGVDGRFKGRKPDGFLFVCPAHSVDGQKGQMKKTAILCNRIKFEEYHARVGAMTRMRPRILS